MRMGRNSKAIWSTLKKDHLDTLRLRADSMNMGHKEIGDLIGEQRAAMSLFFSGKLFSAEILRNICDVLNFPITQLMTPEGKERYLHATKPTV